MLFSLDEVRIKQCVLSATILFELVESFLIALHLIQWLDVTQKSRSDKLLDVILV